MLRDFWERIVHSYERYWLRNTFSDLDGPWNRWSLLAAMLVASLGIKSKH